MNSSPHPFVQRHRINTLRFLSVAILALIAVSQSRWPRATAVHSLVEALGLLAIAATIFGRSWTMLYVGGRKNAELVTTGPYSMMRNPLYFFSLLGVAGVGAQTGSVLATFAVTAVAYAVFDYTIRREEAFLQSRFGQVYRDYCASTPRLVPKVSLWRECEGLALNSSKSLRTLRDSMLFLVAWPGIELIKVAQTQGILPVLFRLPF
jgi:protein-S-isoprenylcysteine O-methyltransferase Ste14